MITLACVVCEGRDLESTGEKKGGELWRCSDCGDVSTVAALREVAFDVERRANRPRRVRQSTLVFDARSAERSSSRRAGRSLRGGASE